MKDTVRGRLNDVNGESKRRHVVIVGGWTERPRVLPPFPEDLAQKAARSLAKLGVEVKTGVMVYHEGGHAILGLVVPGADPVHRVTIVPRGQALGVTYQRPDSERYNYPEAYLRARIVGMLGGRAGEEIVYGTKTTGAESDIEQATALARRMVTRWGMSERLGLVELAPRENPYLNNTNGYGGSRPFSDETAEAIDAEVRKIIEDSHAEAKQLLSEHRNQLDALVEALLKHETLNEQEILDVTGLPSAPQLRDGILPSTNGNGRRLEYV